MVTLIVGVLVFKVSRNVLSRWHNKLLTGFRDSAAENYVCK